MSEQEATLDEFTNSDISADDDSDELFGLGKIPADWEIKPLAESAHVIPGNSPPSETYNETGDGLPFFQGNSNFGHFHPEVDTWCSDSRKEAETNDILISIRAPVGDLNIADIHCCIGRGLAALRPTDLNGLYLYYNLAERKTWLSRLATGSTFKAINKTDLQLLDIPIPSVSEQRKIATTLYNIDQAIQKTDAIIEQTEQVQRGIEQRLFCEGYSGDSDTEQKRLVTIPKEWKFEKLSEHTIDSAFGPRFNSDKYDKKGNIATLRTTDLNERGHISLSTMPVANLERDDIEDHLLKLGDFIITRSGTTGIGAVWDGYDKPTIPGAFLIRFRLEDTLNPHFLKYYVNSPVGRKRINRRAQGGVQKNLAGSDLLNMNFPIPNKKEQKQIIEVLDTTENQIKHERQYKNQLQRLKKSLMQDLLSGKVRTTDTNIQVPDEVAQHG